MTRFDLVAEGWLPCLPRASRVAEEVGIEQALLRAHEIAQVRDPSPIVTAALHRLLLAVVHRVFGPKDASAWRRLWERSRFPADPISEYLERWRGRFDLFHREFPFYQTADLEEEYAVCAAKLSPHLAAGNNATLFDHTTEEVGVALSSASAARYLVALQAFSVGGLVSARKDEQKHGHKSAKGSPLVRGAVSLVAGGTLFETLLLNLHRYDPAAEQPFSTPRPDMPAWERDEPTEPATRPPDGYLDLLTFQSRRVRLLPDGPPEAPVVRRSVVMKGFQFPDNYLLKGQETMLAFVRNSGASPTEDPWPAVRLGPARDVWRDSLALLQSVDDKRARPRTLDWIDDLVGRGHLDAGLVVPLDVLGLATDRAKPLLWRHERLTLPLRVMMSAARMERLRVALGVATRVARQVQAVQGSATTAHGRSSGPSALWVLASELLRPQTLVAASGGGAAPPRDAVRACVRSLGAEAPYWSRLSGPFSRLLLDLSQEDEDVPPPESRALHVWQDAVGAAAKAAFAHATGSLGGTGRSLRAVACAEPVFQDGLSAALDLGQMEEDPVGDADGL